MAGYYADAYNRNGLPGVLNATWNAPGVYLTGGDGSQNAFTGALRDLVSTQYPGDPNSRVLPSWLSGLGPAPRTQALLMDPSRPQGTIAQELFALGPGALRYGTPAEAEQVPPPAQATEDPTLSDTNLKSIMFSTPLPMVPQFGALPAALDTRADVEKAYATGPKKRETDVFGDLLGGFGQGQWDQNAATGTNIMNLALAGLGGFARGQRDEKNAENDYQASLLQHERDKAAALMGATRQNWEDRLNLQLAEDRRTAQTTDAQNNRIAAMAPKISDGVMLAPVQKGNNIQWTVQGLPGGSKETRKLIANMDDPDKLYNAVLGSPNGAALVNAAYAQLDPKVRQNAMMMKDDSLIRAAIIEKIRQTDPTYITSVQQRQINKLLGGLGSN